MPKFTIGIQKSHKRKDNTIPVTIVVSHEGDRGWIKTGISVGLNQVTKGYKLKDTFVIEDLNKRINRYKKHCEEELRDQVFRYSAKQLAEYFEDFTKTRRDDYIDFIKFWSDYLPKIKNTGTRGLYKTTLNSVCKFIDPNFVIDPDYKLPKYDVTFITKKFLELYMDWLIKNNADITDSGRNLHFRNLRHIFYEARKDYNDEEIGIIKIPQNPFKKFEEPKPKITRKRALEIEQIKQIRDFDIKSLDHHKFSNFWRKGEYIGGSRAELAVDVFLLSFYLIGMNTADIYEIDTIKDNRLEYRRKKTKGRRGDEAFISVKIEPEVLLLISKYADPSKKRVFNFYQKWADTRSFNKAVNKGLKQIGDALKLTDLEHGAARHSWATAARNNCNISKSDVDEYLNHASEFRLSDIYIKKNWEPQDKANRKVLDLLK